MATRAGQATVRTSIATVADAHNARASTNAATVDPGTAAGDGGDQAFELAAGASITIKSAFRTNASAATPVLEDLVMWIEVIADNTAAGLGNTGIFQAQTLNKAAGTLATGTLYNGSDVTFFATSNGTNGGTPVAGTYRIRVHIEYAQGTNDPTNGGYKADSDGNYARTGTPNTWTATIAEADEGFLRAGVKFTFSFSNANLGGAAPAAPGFVYPESQFFQLLMLTDPGGANCSPITGTSTTAMTLNQIQAAANVTTDPSTNSTNQENWTRTGRIGAASGVNNAFAAAATNTGVKVSIGNSTLSGIPWTHFTSLPANWTGTTGGGINTQNTTASSPANLFVVDPRIQFSNHLLQLNDATFGTPPMSKNVASGQRLTADLGFIAAQALDMRGNALANGLAWTEKLWDSGNLISSEASPWKTRASTGTTQGGQTSWTDALDKNASWDAQLPGGSWTQKEVVTTPNANGLETGNTRTLTLLAINPNLKLRITLSPTTATALPDHLSAGQAVRVVLTVIRLDTNKQIVVDASPVPSFVMVRYDPTANLTQYLGADLAWHTLNGATMSTFTMAPAAADANTFTFDFTAAQTSTWGSFDLLGVEGVAYVNGTPYVDGTPREFLGTANPHSAWTFDAVGFATGGKFSFK